MQFSIWDSIAQFDGVVTGLSQATCDIALTGNSMMGSSMEPCQGTATVVNASLGLVDYSGYPAEEECLVCWIEVEFTCTDATTGCICTLTEFIPFHTEPLDGVTTCQGPFEIVDCAQWANDCPAGTCFGALACIGDPIPWQLDFSDNLFNGGATATQAGLLTALEEASANGVMEYASGCTFGMSYQASNNWTVNLIWDWKTQPGPAAHVRVQDQVNSFVLEMISTAGYNTPFDCEQFCSYRLNLTSITDPTSSVVAGESFDVILYPALGPC